jgi:hypothetical protein
MQHSFSINLNDVAMAVQAKIARAGTRITMSMSQNLRTKME